MSAEENNAALIEWARNLKWEAHVDDPFVIDILNKLKTHITSKGSNGADEDLQQSKRVKLVVVGDGAVGKTSLLIRFATNEFPTEYLPTVFENYTAQMKRDNDTILLHLWDTAGQEDYDRLRPLSYPGADVVLLCFSTINRASYDAIREKWAPEVHHYIPNIPHILVGTKIDLREAKTPDPNSGKFEPITLDLGQSMATEIHATKYMEICSKSGQGVAEVFEEAVSQVLADRNPSTSSASQSSPNKPSTKPKKKMDVSSCKLYRKVLLLGSLLLTTFSISLLECIP